jgi:hypothetical protein
MELHTREYLISRVVLGVVRVKAGKDLTLFVNPITPQKNYEAQEVYQKTFEEAYFDGIPTRQEVDEMMIDRGLWGPAEEKMLKKIGKDIDDFKMQLYKALFDSKAQTVIRRLISQAKERQLELYRDKHIYNHTSCEGVASYARSCWIIENCTTTSENIPYNFSGYSISQVLANYQTSILGEEETRELARTDPWRSIWSASKKEGSLFGKEAILLTDEQKHLMMWSSMYDSISESPEAPSDAVIEDDDMIDGWLLIQKKERENARDEKSIENVIGNEKISGAGEVFVTAKSQEDIDLINKMNDPRGSIIKEQRMKQVKSAGVDGIKHQHLQDVKQDILQAKIEQAKQGRR